MIGYWNGLINFNSNLILEAAEMSLLDSGWEWHKFDYFILM